MQKNITIKTEDNHLIYGILNSRKKSNKLIIFVHGLTGNKNEHIFFNGSKFFAENGFDTFRFDLYTWKDKGRKLSECTLKIHTIDTNTVVKHFKKKYRKIFLVGHSYGGLTILQSDVSGVSGLVLWDSASLTNVSWISEKNYNKHLDAYIMKWGNEFVIGKEMFEETRKFPKPGELMKRINVPIKIICAGKASLVDDGKLFFKYAKNPKEFSIIKGAGHTFSEEGSEEELFAETLKFVDKYSK